MEAWKIKRKTSKKPKTKLGRQILGVVLIFGTLFIASYDFPAVWNKGAASVQAKTNVSLPQWIEEPFKLGLDLQGGTHLVYEANMDEIPAGDRMAALEGVRDVIERRVNAYGVAEPVVQTVTTGGVYRVIVELAGVLNVNEAISLIGETPVLEFKEPGMELSRKLTEEEQAALDKLNQEQRALGDEVLKRALRGDNFNSLVAEYSVEEGKDLNQGKADGLTLDVPVFEPIVQAVIDNGERPGRVVPKVIETERGLQIIKFLEKRDSY